MNSFEYALLTDRFGPLHFCAGSAWARLESGSPPEQRSCDLKRKKRVKRQSHVGVVGRHFCYFEAGSQEAKPHSQVAGRSFCYYGAATLPPRAVRLRCSLGRGLGFLC